ncbi:MAG: cyanophycinase [Candidatus Cloacimonetes bacterium]|nr:cyanophycinase [Candidatus Cloacimonadota bacterium]
MISNETKGHLVLIGGNEDKIRNREILHAIVKINNVQNIAVIPTASRYYPRQLGDKYKSAFKNLGVKKIELLDIRTAQEADKEENFEKIKSADCIFFTGGDQVRLVDILQKTKLLQVIKDEYQMGKTVAGTSAGAAAASNPMIFDGDEMGFLKGSVNHSEGFGFINNFTVDTHFITRGRISRLTQFLLRGYSNFGIGLAEDTGIILYPNNQFEVIGSHIVTILNSENVKFTNYKETNIDERFTTDGFQLGFLSPGTIYDINKKSVIKIKKIA